MKSFLLSCLLSLTLLSPAFAAGNCDHHSKARGTDVTSADSVLAKQASKSLLGIDHDHRDGSLSKEAREALKADGKQVADALTKQKCMHDAKHETCCDHDDCSDCSDCSDCKDGCSGHSKCASAHASTKGMRCKNAAAGDDALAKLDGSTVKLSGKCPEHQL